MQNSVEVMREARKVSPLHFVPDRDINRKYVDWYDRMINMWGDIIRGSMEKGDDKPLREAVDGNVMFVLEWWSITAPEMELSKHHDFYNSNNAR